MNTVAKGTRKEKLCEDFFKEKGWATWRTSRNKFQQLDAFGLFDVISVHPDGTEMYFIQVKSNRCSKKVKDSIRAFKMPPKCHKEVWIYIDREGWKKERL